MAGPGGPSPLPPREACGALGHELCLLSPPCLSYPCTHSCTCHHTLRQCHLVETEWALGSGDSSCRLGCVKCANHLGRLCLGLLSYLRKGTVHLPQRLPARVTDSSFLCNLNHFLSSRKACLLISETGKGGRGERGRETPL